MTSLNIYICTGPTSPIYFHQMCTPTRIRYHAKRLINLPLTNYKRLRLCLCLANAYNFSRSICSPRKLLEGGLSPQMFSRQPSIIDGLFEASDACNSIGQNLQTMVLVERTNGMYKQQLRFGGGVRSV